MQYSVVNFKKINESLFRLEAEFYNSNSLLNINCFTGEEVIDFVQYGTSKEFHKAQTILLSELGLANWQHKQSKHLLKCAKRAVEIAIEKDEKNALVRILRWI